MKIAITGKGGSGKTFIAAGLSLLFAQTKKVIAVDCDPDMNLGLALGFPQAQRIIPISTMKELIAERTESGLGRWGGYFKLNPRVEDIPQDFCPEHQNIRLIVMGKVNKAGGGCLCPENTFIKNLLAHLILSRNEVVIVDMVAGSEHLGRGTAGSVDAFLIVTEPTDLGINTGLNIKSLALDLGIKKIFFVGNKINHRDDIVFLEDKIKEGLLSCISFSRHAQENRGKFVFDAETEKEFNELYDKLIRRF